MTVMDMQVAFCYLELNVRNNLLPYYSITLNILFWWFSGVVIPVLIPNTEVKHFLTDGSPSGARVGIRQNKVFKDVAGMPGVSPGHGRRNYDAKGLSTGDPILGALFCYNIPMLSWRIKRQLSILIGVFVIVGGLTAIVLYRTTYEEPTCFDGKQNGGETGTDCGGACEQICRESVAEPEVLWTKIFKVTDDIYSAFAYIENRNKDAEVELTSYEMTITDDEGEVLEVRKGFTSIQANKRFGIFEGTILSQGAVPSRVEFEFNDNLYWQKTDSDAASVVVRTKSLSREETIPRIDAILQNDSIHDASDIEAVAVVYDADSQAIGASRTVVNSIPAGATAPIVFTWPIPFEAGTEVCETPVDVALVIDRSGSMDDDGENPPQPLTSVKEAARLFIDRLKGGVDRVSVISFANDASGDFLLSSNLQSAKNAVGSILIDSGSIQNTNIFAGLESAGAELQSERRNSASDSVLVVLTDGVATLPEKSGDELFPETAALSAGSTIKSSGIDLYTIGLGTNINKEFMTDLATNPDHFFQAFSSAQLESVYESIATDICRRGPRVIEIITRPVPQIL